MKNMGINKKIDDLGRVVIPREIREKLGIRKQDELEIYIDDEKIVLSKSVEMCIFCGSKSKLTKLKNKNICTTCLNEMNQL